MRAVSHILQAASRTRIPPFLGVFSTMFTLQTGVPAFQRVGRPPCRPWRRTSHEESSCRRDVTRWCVAIAIASSSASSWTALLGMGRRQPRPGAGLESDLHRHAHCDEYTRTPPVSGSGRSFTRRSSMPTTASNGATRHSSFTMRAPRGASRRAAVIAAALHRAGRPVPVATAGARCQLCGFARGAERRSSEGSAASRATRGHRLGNRGRAGRARLARDRWVQREHPYPAFTGGTAVGQWRPTPPASPPIAQP